MSLLFNGWYLDDGILCGNPDDLTKAFPIIEKFGPSINLKFNLSKCLLYLPPSSDISNPFPSTTPTSFEGFMLLGSPIDPPDYCASAIQERVEKVKAILCSLPDLQDSQYESTLLRSCLSLSKISIAICTCPSHYISDALPCFNCSLATFISDLIGAPLPEWSQLRSSLLGWFDGEESCSAAYLASVNQLKDLMAEILCCSPPLSDHLTSSLSSVALAANRSD